MIRFLLRCRHKGITMGGRSQVSICDVTGGKVKWRTMVTDYEFPQLATDYWRKTADVLVPCDWEMRPDDGLAPGTAKIRLENRKEVVVFQTDLFFTPAGLRCRDFDNAAYLKYDKQPEEAQLAEVNHDYKVRQDLQKLAKRLTKEAFEMNVADAQMYLNVAEHLGEYP